MSAIPDFIQNPDYFSIFMIWASGYIFGFVVFKGSRVWKEMDSTMKLVVAILLGFLIEFCVILPLFYILSVNNILTSSLFVGAFNNTWAYHGAFTLLFSMLALRGRQFMLKAANFIFSYILPVFFFITGLTFFFIINERLSFLYSINC